MAQPKIEKNTLDKMKLCCRQNDPLPTTPKPSLDPKKVMLCTSWEWKGVLYHELLLENQMINSNKYASQLDKPKAAVPVKHLKLVNRKHIIFHQDSARRHVSLMTRLKLLQLDWKAWLSPSFLHSSLLVFAKFS